MKYKKWLSIACVIIVLVGALMFVFEKLNTEYTNKDISPNKTNLIKIEVKGPTGFLLFGPSDIKIKCRKNNFIGFMNGITINTSISNDGGRIDDSNINLEWISEDIATITLSGQEQTDKVIKVKFDDAISYE